MQSTGGNGPQTAVAHDDQEPIGNHGIRNAVPASMGDIMDDPQLHDTHNGQAQQGREVDDNSVARHSDSTVDLFVGAQPPWANLDSINTENASEVQDLGDGGNSLIQYISNMGGDAQHDDAEVIVDEISGGSHSNQYIEQADNDLFYESDGIFQAVEIEHDEDEPLSSYGETEVDSDHEESAHARDHELTKHSCIRCSRLRMHDYPSTRQTIAAHLSIAGQQTFTSLNDLLSSHNAPGRGLYKIEEVVKEQRRRASNLQEDIRCLQAQLAVVNDLEDEASAVIVRACTTFSNTRAATGISNKLWAEYEAFCESLESKFGSERGWSVYCFKNHKNSYVQWDPDLELFKDSAEISLEDYNVRCEATTNKTDWSTEYVVEFWPLDNLEPRTEVAKTWRQQYPNLYRLAEEAVNNSPADSSVAKELLESLPDPGLSFTGGWLFEYAPEPARAKHSTVSRRWSYRRAYRIPLDGPQDFPKDNSATTSGSESTAFHDTEMVDEGYGSCESRDVDMDDDDSGSAESWHAESDHV